MLCFHFSDKLTLFFFLRLEFLFCCPEALIETARLIFTLFSECLLLPKQFVLGTHNLHLRFGLLMYCKELLLFCLDLVLKLCDSLQIVCVL